METILHIITIAAVLVGTFFSAIGVIGLIRLPDVYTRLHATSKVGVFGVLFLLVAVATQVTPAIGRGLLLLLLLIIAGPATAHALGSAAYRFGIPLKKSVRDDLARDLAKMDDKSHIGE